LAKTENIETKDNCNCGGTGATDLRKAVEAIVASTGKGKDKVIPLLQAVQDHFRYIPSDALKLLYELTEVTPAQVTGVSTFYSQFRHVPYGEHIIKICTGTACHVKGADLVGDALRRELKLTGTDHTTADGRFSIENVACLGCCTLAPVVQIDNKTYGHVLTSKVGEIIEDFLKSPAVVIADLFSNTVTDSDNEIRVGLGSCCIAGGSNDVIEEVRNVIAEYRLNAAVKPVGCVGVCNQTPLLEIAVKGREPKRYTNVKPREVQDILLKHIRPVTAISRLRGTLDELLDTFRSDELDRSQVIFADSVREKHLDNFLSHQKHIATEHYGVISPLALQEYIDHGGFAGYHRACNSMEAVDIRKEILDSGLRGRGGGGFPTGKKWDIVAAITATRKVIVCNGDEGDPGAFMDRMLLESFPFRVIEGMLIAARATGATEGILYIRAEYPLAVERINSAIKICEEFGYLTPTDNPVSATNPVQAHNDTTFTEPDSKLAQARNDSSVSDPDHNPGHDHSSVTTPDSNLVPGQDDTPDPYHNDSAFLTPDHNLVPEGRQFGSPGAHTNPSLSHRFTLRVFEGAGAFVCGEETALIASIEGSRGTPHFRPPFPAESGLHGLPTLVNNVETFCLVPWIIRNGATAFASIGTAGSKGTKVFALAGKVARGGLIEVPMGITIRRIVEDIGEGVLPGRTFKAVQIGGPSGGCIPARMADTPVDFEELTRLGAMMGSGGLVVLDNTDCLVDMAKYFLTFTHEQSCGKCTYCRVGTGEMLRIVTRLSEGKATIADLDELQRLCHFVKDGSLCGLGKTAPNPVITNLLYFRDEFEAHTRGICPAGRCKDLIKYTVNDNCIGCTKCVQVCPVNAIPYTPYEKHTIDQELCTRCDSCREVCPVLAIDKM
jgi:NADH:ubiquinone oxidoreductase subunit F (NADH-binding)/NADH:ubiquinone oxidoreductase subunit E/NAD-dependent dihydropyrimidine dehydrogenase PreA subunit